MSRFRRKTRLSNGLLTLQMANCRPECVPTDATLPRSTSVGVMPDAGTNTKTAALCRLTWPQLCVHHRPHQYWTKHGVARTKPSRIQPFHTVGGLFPSPPRSQPRTWTLSNGSSFEGLQLQAILDRTRDNQPETVNSEEATGDEQTEIL